VAVPTFNVEGLAQHDNPAFHEMGDRVGALSSDFGLAFRNVDERVYEITLPGHGEELVGFHAHADVVPVNPDLWVLEDGTKLDPFKVTRIGDRMYGRGTEDDKNGIIVALYAMRVLQDAGLPVKRTMKLLVDTTEETSSDAIPYYFESNPVPEYNLALDGDYPVAIAEKGFGTVMATFPVRSGHGEGGEIVSLTGGLATNQIPSQSTAQISSADPAKLAGVLNRKGSDYVLAHGINFSITAAPDGEESVRLVVAGESAHSSEPENGVNPVSRMLDFINGLAGMGVFQDNHVTDAARYASENWGLDFHGNKLGIAFSHDFMGPLTAAQTFVALNDDNLRLAVNLRVPVGKPVAQLQREISAKLDDWAAREGVDVGFTYQMGEPMYRNPEGKWVNALLDVATENLGLPREFSSSAGGTSVHNLPNGVQFGLAIPGRKYTGHNANEFKTVDQFLMDLQIITEMMARIGGMDAL
jgi:predicted dipeptidase